METRDLLFARVFCVLCYPTLSQASTIEHVYPRSPLFTMLSYAELSPAPFKHVTHVRPCLLYYPTLGPIQHRWTCLTSFALVCYVILHWKTSFEKKLFFCVGEYAKYGFDQQAPSSIVWTCLPTFAHVNYIILRWTSSSTVWTCPSSFALVCYIS